MYQVIDFKIPAKIFVEYNPDRIVIDPKFELNLVKEYPMGHTDKVSFYEYYHTWYYAKRWRHYSVISRRYNISIEEAEDCINDVWEVIYNRWDNIENPEHYFNKALKFCIYNTLRNTKNRHDALEKFRNPVSIQQVPLDIQKEQQEIFDRIVEIADRILTVEEMVIFTMYFLEEQNYKTISNDLKINQVSLRKKISRMREKLKSVLANVGI